MSNEMKIKGFGSWANGKWHLTGKAVWARGSNPDFAGTTLRLDIALVSET